MKSFASVISAREAIDRGRPEPLGGDYDQAGGSTLSCRKAMGSDLGHLEVAKGDHPGPVSVEFILPINSWPWSLESVEMSVLAGHPSTALVGADPEALGSVLSSLGASHSPGPRMELQRGRW